MKVLIVQSRKGGTGKTTMSIHWGMLAVQEGKSVVWVELDDQGSLVGWFGTRQEHHPDREELFCVVLESVDQIEEFVEHCRREGDVDLLVLDTRPNVLGFTRAAMKLADLCAVVCKPSSFDLAAVQETLALAQEIGTPAGVVVTCAQSASLAREARHILQDLTPNVCPKHITARTEFIRACAGGLTVEEMNPKGKGAQEVRATWKWLNGLSGGL